MNEIIKPDEWTAFWSALERGEMGGTYIDRDAGIIDGRGHRVLAALLAAGWAPPAAERIEPGAEAAHRDDLAREIAQWWVDSDAKRNILVALNSKVGEMLDRLAQAYGMEP